MNYKLISTDFDDTLLDNKKQVTDFTKDTLFKYRNNGFKIVGVTARPLMAVTKTLDIDMFDYVILNNGTHIYDVKNKKGEVINKIDSNIVDDINNRYKDKCKNMAFITYDVYYTLRYLNDKPFNVILDRKLNEVSVERINIMLDSTFDLEEEVSYINNSFNGVYAIIMQDSNSSLRWITVSPNGINKANTLKLLGERIGISLDEMIFFGDSLNDIEVIKEVGLGVAMKNAIEKIKQVSASETEFTNDEDGVAKYLIRNIKLKENL